MSKGYLSHFLLLTTLFFCSLNYAQTQKESKKELLIVLSQLEVKFNISFSFADKSVKNIKVTIPKNTNS